MTGRKVRVSGMPYAPHLWMRRLGNAERGFSSSSETRLVRGGRWSGGGSVQSNVLIVPHTFCLHWFRKLKQQPAETETLLDSFPVDVPSSNLWTTSLKTHLSLWDSVAISTVCSSILRYKCWLFGQIWNYKEFPQLQGSILCDLSNRWTVFIMTSVAFALCGNNVLFVYRMCGG